MKNLIINLVLIILILSCGSSSNVKLSDDPDILKVFDNSEVSLLDSIVMCFNIYIISDIEKKKSISQHYYEYFDRIKKTESIETLEESLASNNSKDSEKLNKLIYESEIFEEIWTISYVLDYESMDTVSRKLELNQKGKYWHLLNVLARDNSLIHEYVQLIKSSGVISPASVALFLKGYQELDFQREVNRLVFVVHYITILSPTESNK